jgi:hypothetical protein
MDRTCSGTWTATCLGTCTHSSLGISLQTSFSCCRGTCRRQEDVRHCHSYKASPGHLLALQRISSRGTVGVLVDGSCLR